MKSAEFLKLKQEAENENTSGEVLTELAQISNEPRRRKGHEGREKKK